MYHILSLFSFLFLLFVGHFLQAEPFHPFFYQFDADDGLPSSEVYTILQDKDDFIWFGTDEGVARFDGYEFEVFGPEQGLEDQVVFQIHEDAKGLIWVSTYDGQVFYFLNGCFHPYEYNQTLLNLKKKSHLIKLIDPNFPKGFLFLVEKFGLFYLDENGNVNWINTNAEGEIYLYQGYHEATGSIQSHRVKLVYDSKIKNSSVPKRKILYYDHQCEEWRHIGDLSKNFWLHSFLMTGIDDEVLLFGKREVLLINKGEIQQELKQSTRTIPFSFPHHKDGYLFCSLEGEGLNHVFKNDDQQLQISTLLPGHSISYGLYDRQGGLWLASRDAGVFYAPHPEMRYFGEDLGLPHSKTFSNEILGDSLLFIGYLDGSIYQYDILKQEALELESKNNYEAYSLFYYSPFHILYSNKTAFSIKPDTSYEHRWYSKTIEVLKEVEGLSTIDSNKLLVISNSRLFQLDLKAKKLELAFSSEKNSGERLTFRSYFIDQKGQHWVGTLHGLMQLYPDRKILVEKNLGHPAFKERIDDIKQLSNGALVFGTRGQGLIYHSDDTTYTIKQDQGLASNNVREIHIDKYDNIWVATLTGISKLSFFSDGSLDIRSFGKGHGLSSREIYNIKGGGDKVWLAGGNGVLEFKVPPIDSISIRPRIRKLIINNQEESVQQGRILKAKENNITIYFNTIDLPKRGDIPYRFRQKNGANWQHTKQGIVNYLDLSPGNYLFEVQSQNQDGIWSASEILQFSIKSPWYQYWYVRLAGTSLLIAVIVLFFHQRDQRRKREQSYASQIDKLERAALHAQMNPHFIFNSLSSIQSYILKNDKKSAVAYLAKFAKLVRETLRVSANGEHSMADEISLLKNYISLEKLRFQGGFESKIIVADHLMPDQIILPSLLIQPFVENAIKHGLKDREEGGQVEIIFEGKPTELQVRIIDNGIGFSPQASGKSNSMGIGITKRRLELMGLRTDLSSPMEIQLCYADDGQITGTEIIIFIRTQLRTPSDNTL